MFKELRKLQKRITWLSLKDLTYSVSFQNFKIIYC